MIKSCGHVTLIQSILHLYLIKCTKRGVVISYLEFYFCTFYFVAFLVHLAIVKIYYVFFIMKFNYIYLKNILPSVINYYLLTKFRLLSKRDFDLCMFS